MLLAPGLLAVGFAIHPPEPKSGAQLLEVISINAGRWNAAHILFCVSMVLSIPAVLGLIRLLGQRGAWFGLIGGMLTATGVVFFSTFIGVELAMSAIASVAVEEQPRAEPAMQALVSFYGPLPAVFIGLSFNLGVVVLAIGSFITRAIPRWTSVLIAGSSLVLIGGVFSNPIGALGAALMLVGLGTVGLRLLKAPLLVGSETDRE